MLFSPSHHNESNLRPTRSDTQPLIFDWKKFFIWPWWWLQLRLSKRKSLLPTTVLLGTTHTKMIKNRSNVTSGFKPFTIQTTILANIISYQQQLNKKKNNNKQTYGQGKELIKHRNSDWKLHYYRNDIFHRLSTSLLHFLMYFWRFCSFEPSLYLVLLKGSSFTSLQILLDSLMVRWEMVKKL